MPVLLSRFNFGLSGFHGNICVVVKYSTLSRNIGGSFIIGYLISSSQLHLSVNLDRSFCHILLRLAEILKAVGSDYCFCLVRKAVCRKKQQTDNAEGKQ